MYIKFLKNSNVLITQIFKLLYTLTHIKRHVKISRKVLLQGAHETLMV